MATRYYLIGRTRFQEEPWVIAESADEAWLTDESLTWHPSVVLSETEAELDPDYHEAVRRWRARDDGALLADMTSLEAEAAVDDAEMSFVADEARAKGLSVEEIAQAVADHYRQEAHSRASRPPDEEAEEITAARHDIMLTTLKWASRLAKHNPQMGRALLRNTAKNLRSFAQNDDAWERLEQADPDNYS